MSKARIIVAGIASVGVIALAGPASANSGGVPNGFPDTCGVGRAETADFIADATFPGVSEIKLYPPVTFGCTGRP
jgi:hypothetical protein